MFNSGLCVHQHWGYSIILHFNSFTFICRFHYAVFNFVDLLSGEVVASHVLEFVEFVFKKLMSSLMKFNFLTMFLLNILKWLCSFLLWRKLLNDLIHILHTSRLIDLVEVLFVLGELFLTSFVVQIGGVLNVVLVLVEVGSFVCLFFFLFLFEFGCVDLIFLLHLFD